MTGSRSEAADRRPRTALTQSFKPQVSSKIVYSCFHALTYMDPISSSIPLQPIAHAWSPYSAPVPFFFPSLCFHPAFFAAVRSRLSLHTSLYLRSLLVVPTRSPSSSKGMPIGGTCAMFKSARASGVQECGGPCKDWKAWTAQAGRLGKCWRRSWGVNSRSVRSGRG